MPDAISFHVATKQELPIIEQLAHDVWWAHYPSIISGEQIEYMLANGYSQQSLVQQIDSGQVFIIIYYDDKPVGYMGVTEQNSYHFFLNKFYIDASLHRKGIGSEAFNYLINHHCNGFKSISLQVNRRNFTAVNFYFKQGFVIDYVHDFDIGNGFIMDDFVMVLHKY